MNQYANYDNLFCDYIKPWSTKNTNANDRSVFCTDDSDKCKSCDFYRSNWSW